MFGGFKILIPPRANETAFASSHTHGRTAENISDQWGATDFNCFFLFYLLPGRRRGGGVIGVSRAVRKVVQTRTHTLSSDEECTAAAPPFPVCASAHAHSRRQRPYSARAIRIYIFSTFSVFFLPRPRTAAAAICNNPQA